MRAMFKQHAIFKTTRLVFTGMVGADEIRTVVTFAERGGRTTLTVTHDLQTAFAVSQRFSLLHEARLAFEGTREELLASEDQVIREFLSPSEQSLFR